MCVSVMLRLMVSLHPTYVNTVVNAVNRAHLLGLVLSVWELDVGLNVVVLGLVHLMALLSCETVVFMLPAVVLTLIWMVVAGDGSDDDEGEEEEEDCFVLDWRGGGGFVFVQRLFLVMRIGSNSGSSGSGSVSGLGRLGWTRWSHHSPVQ